jgi:acetate kinase
LTGTTDFGAIASSDEPQHKLAFDLFVDRICGFLGTYYVSLEGRVDALVFAGGIGEKSSKLRQAVVQRAACLGFAISNSSNSKKITDTVQDISAEDAKHRVLVCQTDEQFEMARMCATKECLWSDA